MINSVRQRSTNSCSTLGARSATSSGLCSSSPVSTDWSMEISNLRCRLSRIELSARFVAMRNIQVVNFALGAYSCRARYTRRNTSWARSSATAVSRTILYRKLTRGVLYLRSKSSKDCSSPAFTSSINWTSVLAMASTVYQTRLLSKSCGKFEVSKINSEAHKSFIFSFVRMSRIVATIWLADGGRFCASSINFWIIFSCSASGRVEPAREVEVVVEIFRGGRVFRVVDEQRNVDFVQGAVRAQSGKTFLLVVEFPKHRVLVAEHDEVSDSGCHQSELVRCFFTRHDPLDSLHIGNNIADFYGILRILEVDVDRAAAAAVMLHVAVAPRGDSFADRGSLAGADLLEVPAQTLCIHTVVGGGEECGVGSRFHRFTKKGVHARQVSFRFGRFGSPHVHGIIRRVNVENANIRPRFQNADRGLHQPIIDIRAIDLRRRTEFLNPFGIRFFRGK